MAIPTPIDPDLAAYRASIDAARAARNAGLREPLSWLTLVGLHWLRAGIQTFGSDPSNDIVLRAEAGTVPPVAGTLEVIDGRVLVHPESVALALDDRPIDDTLPLADDGDGEREPSLVALASLRLHVIRRGGDRLALRVRDTRAPTLLAFTGVEAFEANPAWRLTGRLITGPPGATIEVPDIVGDVTDGPTPGDVELVIDGQAHRLHALESTRGRLWLVFGDATNGSETYGGGRFLVTGEVRPDGTVEVDFNLAYNPPCVFSPYATCPMVPAGNVLPVRIEAGERMPST
jgi:uncharacterized protein (DUF1684 family)